MSTNIQQEHFEELTQGLSGGDTKKMRTLLDKLEALLESIKDAPNTSLYTSKGERLFWAWFSPISMALSSFYIPAEEADERAKTFCAKTFGLVELPYIAPVTSVEQDTVEEEGYKELSPKEMSRLKAVWERIHGAEADPHVVTAAQWSKLTFLNAFLENGVYIIVIGGVPSRYSFGELEEYLSLEFSYETDYELDLEIRLER